MQARYKEQRKLPTPMTLNYLKLAVIQKKLYIIYTRLYMIFSIYISMETLHYIQVQDMAMLVLLESSLVPNVTHRNKIRYFILDVE